MFKRLFIVSLGVLVFWLGARAGSLQEFQRAFTIGAHHSLSGQFVVHDLPPANVFSHNRPRLKETNWVELDPTLLPISCDRIKKCLLAQLGVRDQWKDKIFINLYRSDDGDETITVMPARFGHDWAYQLDIPDRIERSRLVSGIVEILLLEIAQRESDHSAEIPAWLSQGMSREVLFSAEEELVLERPHGFENGLLMSLLTRTNLLQNPLIAAHEELQATPPLTLEELSWPKPGQFDGLSGQAYRSSAQLFVHQLLHLPDGRQCFRAFLSELPRHLNWQIAFTRAFRSHFSTQLDVEKWWALQLIQFTDRNLAQTLRPDESWQKLDEIVRPAVEVRTSTNELPLHTQVTLQSIIQDWDVPRQAQLLREKSQQLLFLRIHVSQDLVYLVDDYRRALDEYVKKRDKTVRPMAGNLFAPPLDDLARNTLRALDELETRRQQLRPRPQISGAMTARLDVKR